MSEELKTLSGRRAKQYRKDHSDELTDYGESRAKVLELFPTGSVPTVENLEKRILLLEQEIAQKNGEYQAVNQKSKDLTQARQEIEAYLKNEREVNQKQKKNGMTLNNDRLSGGRKCPLDPFEPLKQKLLTDEKASP